MAYRLYTHDVQEGITDFNDMKYHMLKSRHDYSLIFNEVSEQFIVAYNVRYHELDSIDWAQGYYFSDIEEAMDKFNKLTSDIYRFMTNDTAPTSYTLDVIFKTMIEAREEGNIWADPVEDMLAVTIEFMLDNEELFDKSVIEDIRDTLGK